MNEKRKKRLGKLIRELWYIYVADHPPFMSWENMSATKKIDYENYAVAFMKKQ